jgi:hypothetical protein
VETYNAEGKDQNKLLAPVIKAQIGDTESPAKLFRDALCGAVDGYEYTSMRK